MGVCIYIKEQLNHKNREDLTTNIEDIFESVFIEICTPIGKNIIIGVIYRPPNNKFEIFENAMNELLNKIDRENKICYLMGDFNIDLLQSETCDIANKFSEQLFTSCFYPIITKPTRITEHTATLIDNIFTNNIEKLDSSVNGILFSDISDHLPILHVCDLNTFHFNKYTTQTTNTRVINNANINVFKQAIKDISWQSVFSDNSDPELSFSEFSETFLKVYNTSFPIKRKVVKTNIDKNKSPWMTKSVLKSVRTKNKLYKAYLINSNKKNQNSYKKYKNKLNHVIKASKKMYYEDQLIKYKHNTKMIWKTLNNILNKKTKKTDLPKQFANNMSPNIIDDPIEIATKFNDYFVNLGPKLAKNINNTNTAFDKYLTESIPNSFFLEAVTEHEVRNEIGKINATKSPGYDGLSAKIIKLVANEISKPITQIFNQTFLTGNIPHQLKIALVTPIHKSNEDNKFDNYRPISVLTCFAKLLEKIMYKRLINFVEKNNILSEHQYGFRKNRSTELAITEFIDKITKAIDKGQYTIGIFLDLSKAFDTINHTILIKKLEYYGIRGIALKWFQNYLTNRKQIVKYNDITSEAMTITTGVPQGSILGPLLFLLYINDMQNCSKLVSTILFADDTNIFHSHSCLKDLNLIMQDELNKIADWITSNKLSLNTAKTKFILFRSSNKKLKHNITISINEQPIKQVKNTIFLGVIIDEYLTWNDHIDLLTKKIIKSTGIISKIRHFTNLNTLKLVYYALVYPYLIYGNLIWGNTYKKRLQKLMNIQKKIIRLMTFKSYTEHSEPLFNKLNILNIKKINDFLTSLFMFRYHYLNNLPKYFTNYYVTNNKVHDHNTRNASKLHKSYSRTNYVKHSLCNNGVDIWNKLTPDLKNTKSYDIFKKKSKNYFLQLHTEM